MALINRRSLWVTNKRRITWSVIIMAVGRRSTWSHPSSLCVASLWGLRQQNLLQSGLLGRENNRGTTKSFVCPDWCHCFWSPRLSLSLRFSHINTIEVSLTKEYYEKKKKKKKLKTRMAKGGDQSLGGGRGSCTHTGKHIHRERNGLLKAFW
jgi:hypothetical protein